MRHDLQVNIIKELMRQLDEGKNVDAGVQYKMPTSSYTCPNMAEKEWDNFFQNHPQVIGLSPDLPEPGSFFTTDDFGTPVLATRDKDGHFHAFLNACRHRGVRVASESRGKKGLFTCPFHAWSYSARGDLVAIPQEEQFGAVDKSCNGLVALPAVERNGMLWVHPKPDGVLNVEALLGPLCEELADYSFSDLIYGGETTMDMKLNWKLANDTFGETYHFQKLHKNTLGQIFYGDNLAYEAIGKNHRFAFARKSIDGLREMPEDKWKLNEAATVLYYLFPNIQITVGIDFFNLIRIYPDVNNPGRSITRVSSYFTRSSIEAAAETESDITKVTAENVYQVAGKDQERLVPTLESVLEVFNSTIEKEDYVMGEYQQLSAESGLLEHVIFGRNEPALHHYHNTFRKELGMPGLEKINEC